MRKNTQRNYNTQQKTNAWHNILKKKTFLTEFCLEIINYF